MKTLFCLLFVVALTARAAIAPNVVRTKIAGIDVIAYPTGVKDVVTFHGSLPAGDAFAGDDNAAIPTLVGMMLDQGTTTEDKFAIAQKLESVGATIGFDVNTQTVSINAKCLKKDVALVVGLIAEQLRSPAFSPEEFAKAKKQFVGGMQRQLENTDFRAGDAFTRAVYPTGHPNPRDPVQEFRAPAQGSTPGPGSFHAPQGHRILILDEDTIPGNHRVSMRGPGRDGILRQLLELPPARLEDQQLRARRQRE